MIVDIIIGAILPLSIFAVIAIFSDNPGTCPPHCKIDHHHIKEEK